MIIGVTGTNGAGKGAVVDYLVQKGFTHYSVSAAITEEILHRGLPVNRPNMRLVGNDMRQKEGPHYPNHTFYAEAKMKGIKNFLIESIRNIRAAEDLKKYGAILLAVDADRHIRYDRIVMRGSEKDKVDFETWVMEEEAEWHNEAAYDMNVPAVMKMADYTVHNDGTIEELHTQINEALATLK